MNNMEYKTVTYYSNADHMYIVFVPDLPGCFADGETVAEAQENIAQIIEEWKESAHELGREIPKPLDNLDTSGASALDVAKYVLARTGPISTMTLQKLVYYCNAWSLAWFHKTLFPQDFEAWKHGPVCKELFDCHKGKFVISKEDVNSQHELSNSEKRLIDDILSVYADEDPEWLSELTHYEAPWKEARGDLPLNASSNRRIDPALIEEYYSSFLSQH